MYYGIDMGGTSIKTALVTETGQIAAKQSMLTRADLGFEDVAQRLVKQLTALCRTVSIQPSEVHGAGVGVPGFLDVGQRLLVEAPNLHWHDIPLYDVLEQSLGIPVAVENDANVAALGEAWRGGGMGAQVVLCVTVGTGVGGGLVFEHRLHRGVNGMAGEIGHLVVQPGGPTCNCGLQGCLETLASASAIVRAARTAQQRGELPTEVVIEGAADVFRLAAAAQPAAVKVVTEAAHWLGYGLAMAATIINPDAIVIGGGVSAAGEAWLQHVQTAFTSAVLPRIAQVAKLRLATLANDAGVVGAARLIQQSLMQSPATT